jgi:8-oxo-dGTP diphosphatase
VKKEDIPSLPIWEGDKIFLSLLDTEKRFFSLKLIYQGEKLIDHTLEI